LGRFGEHVKTYLHGVSDTGWLGRLVRATPLVEPLAESKDNPIPQKDSKVVAPVDGSHIAQEALRAVIDGGLAGVMRVAESAPSRQKVSETMRNMLTADPERYWWTANDWVRELDCTKSTITGNTKKGTPPCDAWVEIKAWRESNKQSRFPGKL
jgi:hypothetical protein